MSWVRAREGFRLRCYQIRIRSNPASFPPLPSRLTPTSHLYEGIHVRRVHAFGRGERTDQSADGGEEILRVGLRCWRWRWWG